MAAPNTPIGTDLVFPSLPLDQAPGSASHPLPIDKAIEDPHGERCVDGQGALWAYFYPSGIRRYDRNLDVTFDSSVGDYSRPACDDLGAWTLSRFGEQGAFKTEVNRYSEQGLIETYEVSSADSLDSIRPGPNGPLLVFQSYAWSTTQPSVLPVDETHGLMSSVSAEYDTDPSQYGRSGILPRYFLGTLDLSGCQPPKPMPAQPEETLPRVPVPAMDGYIQDVKSSHDGNAYVVVVQGQSRIFIDYPSGRVLPPFTSPPTGSGYTFERQGDILFQSDLRRFRLVDQTWVEQPAIDIPLSGLCSAPRPSGDWLFLACQKTVPALRRQGETWVLVDQDQQGGGSVLDTDGRTLVIGDEAAKGQREWEGLVRVYEIQPDGLGQPVIIKPSDALPYAPGHPEQDYDREPPLGKGFGSRVQVQGAWLLVSDNEGSFGFERTGEGWTERWKFLHEQTALLVDGALYIIDRTEPRGTTRAGAIHVYERVKDSWVERQRVAPTQRWPYFGERFTLLPDRLLVVQPGYGEQRPTGSVFDLPLGACPKL